MIERGVREVERLRRADPSNAFYVRQSGDIIYNRAWLLRDRGRQERERQDAAWKDSFEESLEWLERSLGFWEDMEAEGQLGPRDAGIPARTRREIDELMAQLEAE